MTVIKSGIRSKVVSTKLTDTEAMQLQESARRLFDKGSIKKPTVSDALRYASRELARVYAYHPPTRKDGRDKAAALVCQQEVNDAVFSLKSQEPLIGLTVNEDNPEEVCLPPLHTLISGITREAGKTTALEGILSRWQGKKILTFVCKPGEQVFQDDHYYPRHRPFLKQRSDWRYIQSMIEAEFHEKNRSIRAELMVVCEDTSTLEEVWDNVVDVLDGKKYANVYEKKVYIQIYNYLKEVIPKISETKFVQKLKLKEGRITVMDLQSYRPEVQAMVVGSVAEEIMSAGWRDVVLVIPEAWQILPRNRASPAKLPIESLIRMGAARGNLVMVDSQDMTSIHTPVLKEIGNLLLGRQQELNEVDRTLVNLPHSEIKKAASSTAVDRRGEIQRLKLGQFLFVSKGEARKVFAMPKWMEFVDALECAINPDYVYKVQKPR